MTFDAVKDISLGYVQQIEVGAPLVIFFGGIAGGFGMPLFEFARFAGEIEASKMFLRDLDQAWYQRGVRGLGHSIDEVAEALQARVEQAQPSRTVAIGNSAGGYAAAVFGALVEVDEAHAIAPQTFLNPVKRLAIRDLRWPRESWRAVVAPHRRYLDLRDLEATRLTIHYSSDDRLDALHAERLRDRSTLRAYPYGGHVLVKSLRDSGDLAQILRSALELST